MPAISGRFLGRIRSRPHDLNRRLFLSKYAVDLPAPPPAVNGYKRLSRLTMAGNDQYGDCVFAAAGHLRQVWTANKSNEAQIHDGQVISEYLKFNHGIDQGANLLDVLKVWASPSGVLGGRIDAYVALDPNDERLVLQAIAIFGGLFTGMELPGGWYQDMSHWSLANAGRFTEGGHCVPICQYDRAAKTYGVYTWGKIVPMDMVGLPRYFDELYAPLCIADWAQPGDIAPNQLNVEQLKQDIAAIRGN